MSTWPFAPAQMHSEAIAVAGTRARILPVLAVVAVLAWLGLAAALLGAAGSAWAETCAEEYCYDSNGRLLEALLCGTQYSYRYDLAGNLIESTVGPGTSPLVCDADDDGLADIIESDSGTHVSPADTGTSPWRSDTDNDGLGDAAETNTGVFLSASDTGSDPNNPDTDGDGVSDGAEVAAGTNPNSVVGVPGPGPLGLTLLAALLFASGAVLYRRGRHHGHTAAALLLALPGLALPAAPAGAAVCGADTLTVAVGQTKGWEFRQAAVHEATGFPTIYTVASHTAPVSVSPPSQTTFQLARFQITGLALGSGSVQINWTVDTNNEETIAAGSCPVTVHVVAPAAAPPPTSANNRDSAMSAGVNLFTGELVLPWRSLLALGGPLPLGLRLYYASGLVRDGLYSSLGDNWRHNYDWGLFTVGTETHIVMPSGALLRFDDLDGDGVFTLLAPLKTPYQLALADGEEHVLLDPRSQLRYRFNAVGQLVAKFDRNGNTHTCTYNNQQLMQVGDGLNRAIEFSYDANGFFSSASDGTRTVGFTVDGGLLSVQNDAKGNITAFTYSDAVADTPGLLKEIVHLATDEIPYTWIYDGTGKVTSRSAASPVFGGTGGTINFLYNNNTTNVQYENFVAGIPGEPATGEQRQYVHDDPGNLLSMINGNGDTTDWSYNGQGQRIGRVDAKGRNTTWGYHPTSGRVAETIRSDGTNESFEFSVRTDALGLTNTDVVGHIRYDGTSVSYDVDIAGNVLTFTDAANQTWPSTYNGRGQRLSTTSPALFTSSVSYNPDGTPAEWLDTAGNATTSTFDELKRLIQLNHPNATTTSRTLDFNNARTSVTDALGRVIQITRNARNQIVQVINRDGLGLQQFSYNTMGNVIAVNNELGNDRTISYDDRGLPVTKTDATLQPMSTGWDNARRPVSVTDNGGQTSNFTFNAVGALTSLRNPLGETWSFGRNDLDQLTGITSPEGRTWSRDPDALNRSRAYIGPRGRRRTIARDPRGLIESVTNADGTQRALGRNADGRVLSYTNEIGAIWSQSLDSAGRIQAEIDPLGNSITFIRDNRNRVSQKINPGDLGIENRSYNNNGQLTQRAFSDGSPSRTYEYDGNGRLSGASGVTLSRNPAGWIISSNGLLTNYDAAGRIIGLSFPASSPTQIPVSLEYFYDSRGYLSFICDDFFIFCGLPSMNFTTDAAGHTTSIARANNVNTTMNYDGDGYPTAIQHFRLDPPGLPILLAGVSLTRSLDGLVNSAVRFASTASPTPTPGTTTIAWNAASRPVLLNGIPYTHDALLRRTEDGDNSYIHHLAGTLASYTPLDTGIATPITYDAFGKPTQVGADPITWNYAFPGAPAAIVGNFYMVHHPMTGALLYKIDRTTLARTYFHYDENDNVWALTNATGEQVANYAYSRTGDKVTATGVPIVIANNPYTWQGKWGVRQLAEGLYLARGGAGYDAQTQSPLAPPRGTHGTCHNNLTRTYCQNPAYTSYPHDNHYMKGVYGGGTEIGSSSHVSFFTGNDTTTPKVFLSSDGNVGIGTNSPSTKLHVSGGVRIDEGLSVVGDVGIGTATPAAKLDVAGDVRVSRLDGRVAGPGLRRVATGGGGVNDPDVLLPSSVMHYTTGSGEVINDPEDWLPCGLLCVGSDTVTTNDGQ